jgi:hypothetical protein
MDFRRVLETDQLAWEIFGAGAAAREQSRQDTTGQARGRLRARRSVSISVQLYGLRPMTGLQLRQLLNETAGQAYSDVDRCRTSALPRAFERRLK